MKKNEKDFDAVKTMREIRDEISSEISTMTYDEEKLYIRERLQSAQGEGAETPPSKPALRA